MEGVNIGVGCISKKEELIINYDVNSMIEVYLMKSYLSLRGLR